MIGYWLVAVTLGILPGLAGAQSAAAGSSGADAERLAEVSTTRDVLANREPLPAGHYHVVLTDDWPDTLEPGEQQGMRWVDFVRTARPSLATRRS